MRVSHFVKRNKNDPQFDALDSNIKVTITFINGDATNDRCKPKDYLSHGIMFDSSSNLDAQCPTFLSLLCCLHHQTPFCFCTSYPFHGVTPTVNPNHEQFVDRSFLLKSHKFFFPHLLFCVVA